MTDAKPEKTLRYFVETEENQWALTESLEDMDAFIRQNLCPDDPQDWLIKAKFMSDDEVAALPQNPDDVPEDEGDES